MSNAKSVIDFPSDYVIVDLETTGLNAVDDDIIEIGALRIRGNKIVDSFDVLANPGYPLSDLIVNLTGITDEMLANAPSIESVLPNVADFIGNDIVVGHNVSFDINFLKHNLDDFNNRYLDTLRISRKLLPELEHHRLCDIAEALHIVPTGEHRALADCTTTFECFCLLKKNAIDLYGSAEEFARLITIQSNKMRWADKQLGCLSPTCDEIDETNPFFGKVCVFTGTLEQYTRIQAAQIVTNLGGICENSITKRTNFLILGNNDYCSSIKGGKSGKQKKAEEYILAGYDLMIIPESVFSQLMESDEDNLLKLQKSLGLTPKTYDKPKQLYYSGYRVERPTPCQFICLASDTPKIVTISVNGELIDIHLDYLREMQPTKKEVNSIDC